jgi:Ca2+-binding EF-hand superfamily protein
MKKSLTIALLLAGGLLLNAQTSTKTFGDGTLPEALRQFDVDDNGVLDEEERQAAKAARQQKLAERLDRWDTNKDGVIDDAEREAAKAAIRERIIAVRTAKFHQLAGEDGLLSLEEFKSIPALATRTEEQIATMFAFLDKDLSGTVSLEEFLGRLTRHQ